MKTRIPQRRMGLVLTGPKRDSKLMFGGPVDMPKVGIQTWLTGPTLDQKETSRCVGFGCLQMLMSEPDPFPIPADPFEFASGIYARAQKLDEWPGEEPEYFGTSIEAGHKALVEMGLAKPDMYLATTIGQIAQHVMNIGPVGMGTPWLSGMQDPDEEGYLRASGYQVGGHFYVVHRANMVAREFGITNSWGPQWGIVGTATLRFNQMEKLLDLGGYGFSTFEEAA